MWSKHFWFADKCNNFMDIGICFIFWQIGGYMNLYNLICTFLYKLFMPQWWSFMQIFFSENRVFVWFKFIQNRHLLK